MSFKLSEIRRALLIKTRAMGDTVLTTPSIAALAEALPSGRVSLLLPPHSSGLFQHDPAVDEVIVYDKAKMPRAADHFDFFTQLQKKEFDLVVCLHASFRTAFLSWMTAAPYISLRNHSGPDWFCNLTSTQPKEAKSIIERDFDALRALGIEPASDRPRLVLGDSQTDAESFFKKHRLDPRKTVALLPGAGKREKEWPLDRFVALAKNIERRGLKPVVFASQSDRSRFEGFGSSAALYTIDHLLDLAAVLGRLKGVIGNDSGPRHLAAAAGGKTLTLFGAEELREWHPYKRQDGHLALKPAGCWVENLTLDEVQKAMDKWLDE